MDHERMKVRPSMCQFSASKSAREAQPLAFTIDPPAAGMCGVYVRGLCVCGVCVRASVSVSVECLCV